MASKHCLKLRSLIGLIHPSRVVNVNGAGHPVSGPDSIPVPRCHCCALRRGIVPWDAACRARLRQAPCRLGWLCRLSLWERVEALRQEERAGSVGGRACRGVVRPCSVARVSRPLAKKGPSENAVARWANLAILYRDNSPRHWVTRRIRSESADRMDPPSGRLQRKQPVSLGLAITTGSRPTTTPAPASLLSPAHLLLGHAHRSRDASRCRLAERQRLHQSEHAKPAGEPVATFSTWPVTSPSYRGEGGGGQPRPAKGGRR